MAQQPYQDDDDNLLLDVVKTQLKPPKRYQVVLLNDDFTPMDFVVEVLSRFFGMSEDKANAVMLAVHRQGKGICGVYSKEVAEMKVAQVNQFSRTHQHPLQCEMEVV
ncbi:MAG: ATP-dependent Clp protease adapter ClpS [Piscirickettsiaceae bacterium CG_4_9_14_3_um_filter_43_564]|nr:ATP-dependent Clp protease adapter ClpS [Thiomicrospira sp.]OIP96953.1 MAG: ATP-dependent Clp protease adapter ClpS [Thiomicrospira sp. CG2_30_44_34]PIQ02608.1 MAG: ATP-dependent Clp protease adapter ClpS [Piscirickettsiaceae bacterium CG18_big_fil_WC_8_21_14_2_50_44_103]PIU39539.1 MAG: ATP-dependent Clp protease adapter ClpS [Piscirickettsiaceae bacterium CG07_land_8_20_14_0_80_44_28]PIW57389.1 MAG: ATP-dependent Clp protease adapter ClpS [Piscirickettsiaceae bacterium CG12_big_fil_rev_8_21